APLPQLTQSHIRSTPPLARYQQRTPSEKVLVRSVSVRTVFAMAKAIAVRAAEIQRTARRAPPLCDARARAGRLFSTSRASLPRAGYVSRGTGVLPAGVADVTDPVRG